MEDSDDIWDDTAFKQQTTELLVNSEAYNDYLKVLADGNDFNGITGHKLRGMVNIPLISAGIGIPVDSASYNLNTNTLQTPYHEFIDSNGYSTTWSRDLSLVAHEYTHGLVNAWYGESMFLNEKQGCAIGEGFSDIIGTGAKRHETGQYQSNYGVGIYNSSTPRPEGLRNLANPALTGGESVYIGNNGNIPGNCSGPPDTPPPSCDDWTSPEIPCPYNWEGYAVVSPHSLGAIIGHLYHLMVAGGFNADVTYRPDGFGVSSDEIQNHIAVERLFYNALLNAQSIGHSMKFCELRERMLDATNGYQRNAIRQAWKHVYEDVSTHCPSPGNIAFLEPVIEISDVNQSGVTYADGDLVDLGTAQHGQTITKSIRIRNTGDYPLRLINPVLTNSKFSQSGLSVNTQVKLAPEYENEYLIDLIFTADTNNGFSFDVLTFETNLPNGEEEQHFITLNLKANTIPPQGGADIYEEDDTIGQANTLSKGVFEARNFDDDGVDWVKITFAAVPDLPLITNRRITLSNEDDAEISICIEAEGSPFGPACVDIQPGDSYNYPIFVQTSVELEVFFKISISENSPSFDYGLMFNSDVLDD